MSERMLREARERAGVTVGRLADFLRAPSPAAPQGRNVSTAIRQGNPARELIRAATEMRADLIVVGSEGLTGLERFLLGSVSERVARHAPCSVLVVRGITLPPTPKR